MKPKLCAFFVLSPEPEARRELDAALDSLADALAERIVSQARAEVDGRGPEQARAPFGSEQLADAVAGGRRG